MAHTSLFRLLLVSMMLAGVPGAHGEEPPSEPTSLSQAIDAALSANLGIKSSQAAVQAAEDVKMAQRTRFFPTFTASYQYEYNDEGQSVSPVLAFPKDQFTFATTATQPVFTGFVLENQYKLAGLGLDVSQVQERLVRQDVILRAKEAFFSVLRSRKLLDVADQTVQQIRVQRDVAENFYNVGMTPLNDLLAAQVELAGAEQALAVAKNNLAIARSNYNTLLRRPLDSPVELADVLSYQPFVHDLAYCQETAETFRPEAEIAELNITIAQRQVDVEKGGYYPTVNLQGNYFRIGGEWDVSGGDGIFDPSGWNVTALASWNFWEWGRTRHSVQKRQREFEQAQFEKAELLDRIRFQVKSAFLRNKEAEENIKTSETAIERAEENYRINQERYKEQVATNTDVLVARTLLTQTMTNYYNALYDFQLSKAALYRAMGQEILE